MTDLPDWARDPELLEEIVYKALEQDDVEGVYAALSLLALIDPARAELLVGTIKLGLAFAKGAV